MLRCDSPWAVSARSCFNPAETVVPCPGSPLSGGGSDRRSPNFNPHICCFSWFWLSVKPNWTPKFHWLTPFQRLWRLVCFSPSTSCPSCPSCLSSGPLAYGASPKYAWSWWTHWRHPSPWADGTFLEASWWLWRGSGQGPKWLETIVPSFPELIGGKIRKTL